MRRKLILRLRREQGSSLVEFGLISVMFTIVLLGVVEMGRMVLVYTPVASAARMGARYAMVHGSDRSGTGTDGPSGPGSPCTCTQIQTIVQNAASAGLVNTANLTITVNYPDTTNGPGSRVVVAVSYPYDSLIPFFTSLLGVTMGSSSEGVITF